MHRIALLTLALVACPKPDDSGDSDTDLSTDTDPGTDAGTELDVDTDTDTDTDTDVDTNVVADGSCVAPFVVSLGETSFTTGSDELSPSCANVSGGDVVAQFTAPATGSFRFSTEGTVVDSLLSVRDTCEDAATERVCHDNLLPDTHATVYVDLTQDETVAVILSRAFGGFPAPISLSISEASPPDDPVIDSVIATCADGGRRIGLDLEVSGGTAQSIDIVPRAGDDALTCTPDTALFVPQATFDCDDDLDGITSVDVWVTDALGQASTVVSTPCTIPGVVGVGSACGPNGGFATCSDGVCLDDVCTLVSAPVVEVATGVFNRTLNRLGVQVLGSDEDGDVTAVRIRFLTETLDPITVAGPFGEVPYPASDLAVVADDTEVVLTVAAPLPTSLPSDDLYAAEVQLVDRAGLVSTAVTIVLDTPETLFDGATCDVSETLDVCPHPLVCDPESTVSGVCGSRVTTCPDGVRPVPFTDTVTADLTGAETVVPPAACSIATPQAVFEFTAPEAGTYLFTVTPDNGDARVSVALRRACGLPTSAEEIACAVPPDVTQGVRSRLSEGSVLYVVVGGLSDLSSDGSLGPITLNATLEAR